MTKSWWYRFSLLIILVVVGSLSLFPTFFNSGKILTDNKMNLGLDLQGGLYMVLGIDFNKVFKDEVVTYAKKVETYLKDEEILVTLGALKIEKADDPTHEIIVTNATDIEKAKSKILEFFGYPLRLVSENGSTLVFGIGREFKKEVMDTAVSKSIEVIRNRIDEFGVTEPEIVSQGADRIVIQLPGVKDIDRAKDLMGRTAKLEFRFVHNDFPPATLNELVEKAKKAGIVFQKGMRFSDYLQKLNEFVKADIPAGYEIFFSKEISKVTNEITKMDPYLLEAAPSLVGDELQEALVRMDTQQNRPYVALDFKPTGAKIFEEITGKNIGRLLAIVLDGNVYSAPQIQGKIAGGSAQITLGNGDYNQVMTEARDLALVLRAGALPVELVFEEQRVVGPSLGKDAIEKAEIATLVGSIAVFLFVILYYKFSGVLASATLAVNVLLTLMCLLALGATLTLPGIAGIALTVGMAVDGNIIIYERIKEEIRRGLSAKEAVFVGFDKAFWTILDANLTTAIAGFCLLNFGTGPVRGFAVTLLIGIAVTIYTSYFMNRVLFEWYLGRNPKTVSL
jgi:protein-export membrane protein SecD